MDMIYHILYIGYIQIYIYIYTHEIYIDMFKYIFRSGILLPCCCGSRWAKLPQHFSDWGGDAISVMARKKVRVTRDLVARRESFFFFGGGFVVDSWHDLQEKGASGLMARDL